MNTDDPQIKTDSVHGQTVYFPSPAAWKEILAEGALEGIPLSLPESVASWLQEYGELEVARLGLIRNSRMEKWLPLPLLLLDGRYYRVHYENVICEHCNKRCGASATPDTVSYVGSNINQNHVWAEFDRLEVQQCPHCSGVLRRRQTVWLASPHAA